MAVYLPDGGPPRAFRVDGASGYISCTYTFPDKSIAVAGLDDIPKLYRHRVNYHVTGGGKPYLLDIHLECINNSLTPISTEGEFYNAFGTGALRWATGRISVSGTNGSGIILSVNVGIPSIVVQYAYAFNGATTWTFNGTSYKPTITDKVSIA